MKNETLILIVAFVGILYIMFHHNNIVGTSGPSNVSPQSISGAGFRGGSGGGSTYNPPSQFSADGSKLPSCSGGSCGGFPTPTYITPPSSAPVSQLVSAGPQSYAPAPTPTWHLSTTPLNAQTRYSYVYS